MTASMLESRGQGSAGGIRVSSLPTWAIWSIAAVALLSPVLAFLIAVAVEFLIGSLMDSGGLLLLPFVAAGALGGFLVRVRSPRPRGNGSARTWADAGCVLRASAPPLPPQALLSATICRATAADS